MSIIPVGFAEITVDFRASGTGRQCFSVFGVEVVNPVSQADVDLLSGNLSLVYKPILGSFNGRYNGLRLEIGNDGDNLELFSTQGAGAGTHGGDLTSPMAMVCILKHALAVNRAARGRTFLPDVTEAHVNDDGSLTSAALTLYTAFADGVLAALEDGDFNGMHILHNSARVPDDVTAYTVAPKISHLDTRYVR